MKLVFEHILLKDISIFAQKTEGFYSESDLFKHLKWTGIRELITFKNIQNYSKKYIYNF